MAVKIVNYVFVFESSGIMVESPFILEIGTVFEYWGLYWIVESVNDNELNCIINQR